MNNKIQSITIFYNGIYNKQFQKELTDFLETKGVVFQEEKHVEEENEHALWFESK